MNCKDASSSDQQSEGPDRVANLGGPDDASHEICRYTWT